MQFYQKRTVEEQANRLPQELRAAYQNSQIDRIKISANGKTVDITGYAEYSYLEEKSYKTQPVRTVDGQIQEIDEYETFLTPRLIIKYNMMGIDDYRETMKLLNSSNGFLVQCYDPVLDRIVVNQMYVAPTSMPIIYQQYLIALGIQEFSIELIGTNSKIGFSISFEDAGIYEEFEVAPGATWEMCQKDIPLIVVVGQYIFSTVYDEDARLFNSSGQIVYPTDVIVEGENYYLESIGKLK